MTVLHRLIVIVTLGLLAGSCQGPSEALVTMPTIEALKPGVTATLTAVLLSGDGGGGRVVPASWSSDAPDIVTASGDGRVLGLKLGKATIRAQFENLSATQSIRVVPDYEGTWSGEYRIANCSQTGAGPSYCRYVIGAILPLRTVLQQTGRAVSGTLEFYDPRHVLVETGTVQGTIDDAGALLMKGLISTVEPEPDHPRQTAVTDWKTTVTANGNEMPGGFVKDQRFQNAWGPQIGWEQCEMVQLQR